MADASALPPEIRHDWSVAEVEALFALPFNDLVFRAQTVHRAHFPANQVQLSTLLSIKTGGCPEDCAYCPQAARYDTGVEAQKLMAPRTPAHRAIAWARPGASRRTATSTRSATWCRA
jgi:biotin synthase